MWHREKTNIILSRISIASLSLKSVKGACVLYMMHSCGNSCCSYTSSISPVLLILTVAVTHRV